MPFPSWSVPLAIQAAKRRNGFTIIELVMVIVLVAIVAAVAAPMLFRGTSSVGAIALAKKVQDDIRYAQSLAMQGANLDTPLQTNPTFFYRIRFNAADSNCPYTNQYTIVNDADNDGVWGESPPDSTIIESARNPSTGDDYFCVQTDTGDYAGFTIATSFGGAIDFDAFGVPSASGTITVTKGGESATITVTQNTGRVVLQ
jgi:prepilin-type N-terminal cleavage/methylation domain-containing protein